MTQPDSPKQAQLNGSPDLVLMGKKRVPAHLRRSRDSQSAPRVIMLILSTGVDCDAMSLWCRDQLDCDAVESSPDFELGLLRCRSLRPQILVLDPSISSDAIVKSTETLRDRYVGHLLILDSLPLELHLVKILSEPATSYFSRAAGSPALAAAMEAILAHGRRTFDPTIANRIWSTSRGLRLRHAANDRSVAALLTSREQEVMQLLADGKSVRHCATILGLSESTVDNHKSRLMKKLGIHKSSELTRQALREGLISR